MFRRTHSPKYFVSFGKGVVTLRERCHVNLFIHVEPGYYPEVADVIATAGPGDDLDSPADMDTDTDTDADTDADTEEDVEPGCICAIRQTYCLSWSNILAKYGSSPSWYPCHCPGQWAYQRYSEPVDVLQAAFRISHLQLIVPGIFVACSPGDVSSTPCHSAALVPDLQFTHHVNIITGQHVAPPATPGGYMRETCTRCCLAKRLQLCVSDTQPHSHPGTRLPIEPILFARDFLSLALSYPACMFGPHGSKARVLITTSAEYLVDAMAIVACYLAYSFDEPAANLVRYIDSERTIDQRWRGLLDDPRTLLLMETGARD